jgi:hypothetical protein
VGRLKETPLGKPRHRWDNDFRMDHDDIRWGGMDWIYLAEYRDCQWAFSNITKNLWVS